MVPWPRRELSRTNFIRLLRLGFCEVLQFDFNNAHARWLRGLALQHGNKKSAEAQEECRRAVECARAQGKEAEAAQWEARGSEFGRGGQNRFGIPFWLVGEFMVGLGCSLGDNRAFDPWPFQGKKGIDRSNADPGFTSFFFHIIINMGVGALPKVINPTKTTDTPILINWG